MLIVLLLTLIVLTALSLTLWHRTDKRVDLLARQIETDARIERATLLTLSQMREMARAQFRHHAD